MTSFLCKQCLSVASCDL